jgi:hypothetical protein
MDRLCIIWEMIDILNYCDRCFHIISADLIKSILSEMIWIPQNQFEAPFWNENFYKEAFWKG